MAKDADGNYYYSAGTVNELFDEVALTESDGQLSVETADGVSRVGGLASILGGFRGSSMDTEDLDEGEGAVYWLDNGDTTYSLEAAFHNPDDGAIQTAEIASVGAV